MEIAKDLIDLFFKSIIKIILLIIGIYFFIVTKDSLLTNLAQHDDAWIPDAAMLLAVCMFIGAVIIGRPAKSRLSKLSDKTFDSRSNNS